MAYLGQAQAQIAAGFLPIEKAPAQQAGKEFDSGGGRLSTWEKKEMAEMTGVGPAPKLELAHSLSMPGCQSAPGVVAAQWVLDQMTRGGGSAGNSCLYLLVIVANHNAHNSWAYPCNDC